tara:strand:+ start:581 stop:934 length:354 start_codon:yes stop_codon:yes gene_type:complete
MKDVSSIIDMVLNLQGTNGLSAILTEENVKYANYIKNLLWLHTDPDYVGGTDEEVDSIISNNGLDNKFLNGIITGMVMALSADGRPINNVGVQYSQLNNVYDACKAIILETTDACDP